MKILENLIDKLKVKKIFSEEHSIVTIADRPIYLPNYQELSEEDKIKVNNYKQEININNFATLIKYTNELRDKSKDITNLLIKFLYELEQIAESLAIKKDLGKEVKINQYEFVDYEIKYAKIISLNNILNEKRKELALKLLGLLKYKEEYQKHNLKHNIEYLGILGKKNKLKREIEERGLRNLENTLKVAIIALDSNLEVSRNSLETAKNFLNSLRVYDNINDSSKRFKNYAEKLKIYKNINELIFENKLKEIEDLENLLCEANLNCYDIIPFKLANIEVQIDLEKEKYKDKFIKYFENQYNEILNAPNTLDNVSELVKKINELLIIQKVYQEDLSKELRNKLYEMKFLLLSKKFIKDHEAKYETKYKYEYITYEEKKYYLDIIRREYEQFKKLNSNTAKFIKDNIEWLLKNNSLSNILLKTHPNYLKIILLVNYPYYFKEFFDDYIECSKTKWFDIEYDNNLGSEKSLIIDNESKEYLIENHKKIKLDKQKGGWYYRPKYDFLGDFYLYKCFALDIIYSCNKYISMGDLITFKFQTIIFAPGITKIIANHMPDQAKKWFKYIEFPNSLKEIGPSVFKNFENLQELNCSSLLEKIDSSAFAYCHNLKEINFNNRLKEIGLEAFLYCLSLIKVNFPASIETIGTRAFSDCKKLKSIIFEGSGPKKLQLGTFFNTNLSFDEIILPSEVEEIEGAYDSNIRRELENNRDKLPKTLKRICDITIEHNNLEDETKKLIKM